MKNLYLLVILLVSISLHAQLDKALGNLINQLTALQIQLQSTYKPSSKQSLWDEFVNENRERENRSAQIDYPVFSGIVAVAINEKYQTLLTLQRKLENYNKSCANFTPLIQMHMSLIYFNIPIEPNQYASEHDMVGELSKWIIQSINPFTGTLKPLEFNFSGVEIIGQKLDFIAAVFNPMQNISSYQEKFIIPFGTHLFKQYPHAWLSHLEKPLYHISLARLQPNCTQKDLIIPNNLPCVTKFPLKNGQLKISVKGPTSKPYWKPVVGW
ncbi:MAG: hypothetical protein AB7F19_06990 [Candidatus Babeliales bacterium]